MPRKLSFECVALVLQGGGALGSYQAGVYEALAEQEIEPNWIAGISIGAINSAIIAGNEAKDRVPKLREFWSSVTANPFLDWTGLGNFFQHQGEMARGYYNQMSAFSALMTGASSFFEPRNPLSFFSADGKVGPTSYYDTSLLKNTLERLVDFDRLNKSGIRLSVGAVNVRDGNFAYFDTTDITLKPEHIIASCSLPPGFPATEIDGEFYWDGGLVSNTPLDWVVSGDKRQDTLAFQVDLWPAKGKLPSNLAEVATRQKEILYSSRTRASTDHFKKVQRLRAALAALMDDLPATFKNRDDVELLKTVASRKVYNLVHLIYRSRQYESHSKDYDFSRLAMQEHWQSGLCDARKTLKHAEIFERPNDQEGVMSYDFCERHEKTGPQSSAEETAKDHMDPAKTADDTPAPKPSRKPSVKQSANT